MCSTGSSFKLQVESKSWRLLRISKVYKLWKRLECLMQPTTPWLVMKRSSSLELQTMITLIQTRVTCYTKDAFRNENLESNLESIYYVHIGSLFATPGKSTARFRIEWWLNIERCTKINITIIAYMYKNDVATNTVRLEQSSESRKRAR